MRPLLPASAAAVLVLALAGCGTTGGAPEDYTRAACDSYAAAYRGGDGLDDPPTTKGQYAALLDLARSNARAAAAFDPRWADLGRDVGNALDLDDTRDTSSLEFFDADRRVQADCADAGHDIGDLRP